MKLFEFNERRKAGFIPYYHGKMLFVKSSNPLYGGSKYMISKGRVDANESDIQAALREANEECGLTLSNLKKNTIKLGWKGNPRGDYILSVFIGEVINLNNFSNTDFEISERKWMTPQEFAKFGRKDHVNIVKTCALKMKGNLSESKTPLYYDNWRRWTFDEMKLEFDIKWKKPSYVRYYQSVLHSNILDSLDNWIKACNTGKVTRLPFEKYYDVQGVSRPESLDQLRDQSFGYAYPRFPDKIIQGFKNNDAIPMPIFVNLGKGELLRIAGNTRLGSAYVANIMPAPKILVVPKNV